MKEHSVLPYNYKTLDGEEWRNFSGKLAGCAQPGSHSYGDLEDSKILVNLKKGQSPENAGVDENLISNLDAIYAQGVRTIYNLVLPPSDRDPELIKQLWETKFRDTKYVTEIKGVSTAVEDFTPPTQEQLQLISNDAIEKMRNGENVLVHCRGGMGRTGTILSAIYMKAHEQYDADKAISYIRKNYSKHAVETEGQEDSLKIFGRELQQAKEVEIIPTVRLSSAATQLSAAESEAAARPRSADMLLNAAENEVKEARMPNFSKRKLLSLQLNDAVSKELKKITKITSALIKKETLDRDLEAPLLGKKSSFLTKVKKTLGY